MDQEVLLQSLLLMTVIIIVIIIYLFLGVGVANVLDQWMFKVCIEGLWISSIWPVAAEKLLLFFCSEEYIFYHLSNFLLKCLILIKNCV